MGRCIGSARGCVPRAQMPAETKDIRFPEAGATDACELPSLGTRNQTWVLWKSSKCI